MIRYRLHRRIHSFANALVTNDPGIPVPFRASVRAFPHQIPSYYLSMPNTSPWAEVNSHLISTMYLDLE